MGNRFGGLSRMAVWLGWLAFTAAVAAGPLRWEMDYFLIHGSRDYYRAMLGLVALLLALCFGYGILRRRGAWRWELPSLAALAIALAVLEQPRGLLSAGLVALACFTTGHRLLRWLGIALESPAAVLGLGFAVGSAAYLPVLFIAGALHGYYAAFFLLLVIAPMLLWRQDALLGLKAAGRIFQAARQEPGLRHPLCGIAFVFLSVALVCGAAVALTPSIAYDAMNMHLPAAQYYSARHALLPVPGLDYSYYPQAFESLLTVLYALGGQAGAQMLAPLFFVALVLVLWEIAKACGLDSAAILTGVACMLTTPFILWDASQVKNDVAVALYQLAALYCCLQWRNCQERRWLLLGGALLASSFAVKDVAIFGAVPLVILFGATLWRQKRRLRGAGAFLLLLVMLGSYWQARAFLLTGNPVYPEHLSSAAQPQAEPWRARLMQLWKVPWLVHFEGQRAFVTYQGFESPLPTPLGIALITFAPMAVLARRQKNTNRRACLFYAGVYLLYWGALMSVLRYALAPIALLLLLLMAKTREVYDGNWTRRPGVVRFSISAALAGSLIFGLLGTILVNIAPQQLPLLARRVSRDEYLQANLHAYGALQAFRRLDRHAAAFTVDACERAYAPDPGAFGCSAAGPARIREDLARYNYSFLALPATMSEDQRAALLRGWRAEPVYSDRRYLGFQITRDR